MAYIPKCPDCLTPANLKASHAALLEALERITSAIEHGQIAAATLLAEDARAAIQAAKGD